jgi:hypothetical protein
MLHIHRKGHTRRITSYHEFDVFTRYFQHLHYDRRPYRTTTYFHKGLLYYLQISTVNSPVTIELGALASVIISPTLAAGKLLINTVGQPIMVGPPT